MRKNNIMCTRNVDFQMDAAAAQDSDGRTLDGYAAVFNEPTHIRSWEGDFQETIAPGAFRKTLNEKKPVMQYNHGRDARIGTIPIGTFDSIEEDNHGLHTVGRLFDHPDVERVRQAMQSGDIGGMSFTFNVVRDSWADKNGSEINDPHELSRLLFDAGDRGPLQRTIKEVKLREAGPVLYPAYEGTSVGVRGEELVALSREEVVEMYSHTAGLELNDVTERVDALVAAGGHRDNIEDSLRDGEKSIDELEEQVTHQLADITREWLEAENTFRWLTAEAEFQTSESDAAIRTSETAIKDSAAEKHPVAAKPTIKNVRKRMATINEMRERIAAIEVRNEELNTEYRDAELPEDEAREYNEGETEKVRLAETIKKVEERMAKYTGSATGGAVDSGRQAPNVILQTEVRHDLDDIRNESRSTEDYYNKVRDNAMRMIEKGRPAVDRKHVEEAQERMEGLLKLGGRDEAGHTIAERFAVGSSEVYERAFFKAAANGGNLSQLSPEEFRAMTLGTDGTGGYAIPVQLDPTIIWTQPGTLNPLRGLAKHVQIVGKEYQGVLSSGTTVQRNAEGAETADNSFTMTNYTVRTKRADGFVPFTYESEIGWDALRESISYALAYAKDQEEAHSFMLGDGTGNNPNGLLGTINMTTAKYQTVGAGALAVADWYNLETSLDERYRANAHLLAHKAIFQLVRQYDTAGGAQLWERIGNKQPNELLGYPVHEVAGSFGGVANFDSTVAPTKKIAILGDFSNFLIVDRIGMSVELIPQVFGASNRPTGQRGVFAVWMNNTKVLVDNAFRVLTVQ